MYFVESLRMDPLIGALKRVCTKDYKVDDKLTIPKGMDVTIDVYSLHYDPQYFPEPELYKPERYTNGNADQGALLLFGKGPRQCIGKSSYKLIKNENKNFIPDVLFFKTSVQFSSSL